MGIPLPEPTRSALVRACDAIKASDPLWREEKWVASENLHITAVFLGEVPRARITMLAEAIGDRLKDTHAFELSFAGLRPVPNARRARMLWAAYDDPSDACARLVSTIGAAAGELGIEVDLRPFKAHVTLARARRPRRAGEPVVSALTAAEPGVPAFVSVPLATLFSSTLSQAGPRYETIVSWDFPA